VAARSGVLEVEDGDWFVGGLRKRRFMVKRCAWDWFYGGEGSSFACGGGSQRRRLEERGRHKVVYGVRWVVYSLRKSWPWLHKGGFHGGR